MKTDSNTPDHDLLIILNTKFDQMAKDLKVMADGLSVRVAKLEERAATNDKLINEIQPRDAVKKVEDHERWISEQRNSSKLIKALISGGWVVAIAIAGLVVEYIKR